MNQPPQYTIVVGVDGSETSKAALRWALWHAGLVNGSIVAVQAWDVPYLYNWELPGPEDFAHKTGQALEQTIREVAGESTVPITKCTVNNCAYNQEDKCHALAITIGTLVAVFVQDF